MRAGVALRPKPSPGKAVLDAMQAHPTFAAFLAPEFDPSAFASEVVTADSKDATPASGRSRAEIVVQEISTHLSRVTDAIDRHIILNQDALMQSVGDLGEIRETSDVLNIRTKDLKRSVDKLKNELMEPYQSTEMRRNQLQRIHEAHDLLKKVSRFSFTLLRIRKGGLETPAGVKGLDLRELGRVASNLVELEGLIKDEVLSGISLVAAERAFVMDIGRAVRKSAKDSLQVALKTMNQAELGPALQVFYNLQSLPPVMMDALGSVLVEAVEATKRALDAQTLEKIASVEVVSEPGGSAGSPMAQAGGVPHKSMSEMEAVGVRQRRARYRDHCEKWGSALYDSAIKVWHVQRMLLKRVDATTNEQFLEVVLRSNVFVEAMKGRPRGDRWPASIGSLYWKYWTDLAAAIKTVTDGAVRRTGNGHVIKCYPFFSLTLVGVLNRLLDNTSKHKGALGLPTSQGVVKGNPAALRALMEVLQAPTSSSSSGDGEAAIKKEEVLSEVGASLEERDVLLEALASVRDLYLGESLQRLCRPVEQMFPQVEGYSSAIPSKHDLQAFIKVILGELLSGLAEGGPLLLPFLIKGAVKAVRLFCSKVESMANVSEGAHRLNPLRNWVLTSEKEHNLQLLSLLALLYTALQKMPGQLAAAGTDFIGAVGAGSLGTAELTQACEAIEDLAKNVFIRPYLIGICTELGAIMANMHLESYAPQGDSGGEEEASRFVLQLQDAVAAIRKNHLNRFPATADFTTKGFRWLAARLLRMYVSHAALVRPLNDRGKNKLNRDAAMMETIIGGICKVPELGGAYQELRAFRELVFYGDEQNPFTVSGVMKERFTQSIRPSTLLDFLFSRAPPELSSPHVIQRCSEGTLVEELLAIYFKDHGAAAAEGANGAAEAGGPSAALTSADPRVTAELAHWQVIQVCLDAYAQRMSASQSDLAYIYDIMLNLGALLIKAYPDRLKAPEQREPAF